MMKHPLYRALALAVCVSCLAAFPGCSWLENADTAAVTASSAAVQPESSPMPAARTETVRFSASGDNLIHEGLYRSAARRAAENPQCSQPYDFSYCYANMTDFYAGFDLNWINQESLVNDAFEPSNYPRFSTPGQMAWDLYNAGFRVVSVSNNHSYDKGSEGVSASMALWSTLPADLAAVGFYDLQNHSPIVYKTINNIRIAFLSYTEMTNGISTPAGSNYGVIYLDESDVIHEQMQKARANADFLIVSCHWGTENSHVINDDQRTYAQQLADWGADLIIGTHPHVVQDAEWITAADGRQVFVAYSLGNYLNGQAAPDQMIGLVLGAELEKTTEPDGNVICRVKAPLLYPVINHFDWKYRNGRMYLLRDYNEELAASHGISEFFSGFTMDYIQNVLNTYITVDFLG